MFHGEIFAHFYVNRLCVRLIALFPKHEVWGDLELLRDFRLQRQHRFLIWGLIGLDCHCFNLSSGTVANVERGCDLAFVSRPHFFLLGLCSSATTGGLNSLKVDRRLADVLIFEMADGLLVVRSRMQLYI